VFSQPFLLSFFFLLLSFSFTSGSIKLSFNCCSVCCLFFVVCACVVVLGTQRLLSFGLCNDVHRKRQKAARRVAAAPFSDKRMGVSLRTPAASDGDNQCSATPCTSVLATKTKHAPSQPRADSPEEVSLLPHVLPEDEKSVSATCALSCIAPVRDVAGVNAIRASFLPVSPDCSELHQLSGCVNSKTPTSRPVSLTLHPSHTTSTTSPSETNGNTSFTHSHQRRGSSCRMSHAPTGVSTLMDGVEGVQIEHTSSHSAVLPPDLDDIQLAYSRSVHDGNISTATATESFAVVQYIRPLPRPIFCSISGTRRSLSVPKNTTVTPAAYTFPRLDETLAFVTPYRGGFAKRRVCEPPLP
jgi:hypothetical protein